MEKIFHLKKVPLFSSLHAKELTAIASITEETNFPPGSVIIKEGEPGDCLYLVVRGKVEVIKSMGTPREIRLAEIGPDNYFGEMALFDQEVRSATVVSLEETVVLCLRRFEFEETMREFPRIAISACKEFSRRIRELESKFEEQ